VRPRFVLGPLSWGGLRILLAIPNSIPLSAYVLVLLGDLLVFLLIGLAFRLLKPRKISGLLWVGPLIHLYTLLAVFLALYEALRSESPLALGVEFGLFVVAAVFGALLGAGLGRRIPVQRLSDGTFVFTGGRLLVGLVVLLLVPLALEQAIVLLGSLSKVRALVEALTGEFPFNYILTAVGFLFVLGTFMSLSWRGQVWVKRSASQAR